MSNIVTDAASSQLGKPYIFDTPLDAGNPNPPTFDCSGLTMWCYQKANIALPHNAAAQWALMSHRAVAQAEAGDIMFWEEGGTIAHCAIYMGDGTIIEAPEPGKFVQRMPYAYWKPPLNTVGIFTGSAETGTQSGIQLADLATAAAGGGSSTAGSSLSFGNLFTNLTSKTFWARTGLGLLGTLILLFVVLKYIH